MQETGRPAMLLEVFASRAFRVVMTLGFGSGVLLFGLGLVRVLEGAVGLRSLAHLLAGSLNLGYFGWMGYYVWKVPVLHFGPIEMRWHPMGSRRPRRMLVAEVTGFRWPYANDLWIESRRGTWRMSMIGIARCDRQRVKKWLSDRWVDSGVVV